MKYTLIAFLLFTSCSANLLKVYPINKLLPDTIHYPLNVSDTMQFAGIKILIEDTSLWRGLEKGGKYIFIRGYHYPAKSLYYSQSLIDTSYHEQYSPSQIAYDTFCQKGVIFDGFDKSGYHFTGRKEPFHINKCFKKRKLSK